MGNGLSKRDSARWYGAIGTTKFCFMIACRFLLQYSIEGCVQTQSPLIRYEFHERAFFFIFWRSELRLSQLGWYQRSGRSKFLNLIAQWLATKVNQCRLDLIGQQAKRGVRLRCNYPNLSMQFQARDSAAYLPFGRSSNAHPFNKQVSCMGHLSLVAVGDESM
jgi:hypothetical protein